MSDLYEVVAHSVTVPCKGIDHEGQEKDGRHWMAGSLLELQKADADALTKAGAVRSAAAVLDAAAKVQSAAAKLQPGGDLTASAPLSAPAGKGESKK